MNTVEHMEAALAARREAMFAEFEDQQALTRELFEDIGQMLREDFSAVARKKKRLKIVFDCVTGVLEKMRECGVKKQYAVCLLEVFLDTHIAGYLRRQLGEETGSYIGAVMSARGDLRCSQWSDAYSEHWPQALGRIRL